MSDAITTEQAAAAPARHRKDTMWRRAWLQLRRNRLAMVCLFIISLYAASWIIAEWTYWKRDLAGLTEQWFGSLLPEGARTWLKEKSKERPDYARSNDEIRNMHSTMFKEPPRDWEGGKMGYWFSYPLGTDFAGRDNLLRLMQGGRIAFELAILVAVISITIGFTLGALAGYFGGWIDDAIVYVYSVFASVPDILLIIAITYVTKQIPAVNQFYLLPIAIGLGLTGWVGLCRLIRGEFIKLRERPYVLAATSLGAGHARVMFKHIAPNVMHLIIINFTIRFPGLVMTETVLTYLGLGIQTEPSWGAMINDARQRLWVGNWWELGGVLVVMFFFVLALNLFGDALRDALDPKLRSAEAKSA